MNDLAVLNTHLSISPVPERIKDLLHSHNLTSLSINRLPNNAISLKETEYWYQNTILTELIKNEAVLYTWNTGGIHYNISNVKTAVCILVDAFLVTVHLWKICPSHHDFPFLSLQGSKVLTINIKRLLMEAMKSSIT